MRRVAIVLAGGSGSRIGGPVKKQYIEIGQHPILHYSLDVFCKSEYIDEIVLVVGADDLEDIRTRFTCQEYPKLRSVVAGGRERYHSVYEGLKAAGEADCVFIHDGARPCVSEDIIERCAKALETDDACVAAVKSKDTVKIADEQGYVEETPDRDRVWIIQTPQCFKYKLAFDSYKKLIDEEVDLMRFGINITDDAMVVERYSDTPVKLIEASYDNIKVTTPEDITLCENILARR